jgi:alkylation response protein AidB-like acyl-CoA dehydrogenase
MDFTFSEDQRLFQSTIRDFLVGECTPELIRQQWDSKSGRDPSLWPQLAELGVLGVLAPEEADGLGMSEIDLVLVFEEMGRAGLCESVVESGAIAVPLLRDLGGPASERWLRAVASGETRATVAHPDCAFVADADRADLLIVGRSDCADEVHILTRDQVDVVHEATTDPGRRVFSVDWQPGAATRVASGAEGAALLADAFDRGALACAAQLVGVADKLITMGADYAKQRKQFGVPIGSFQAVKHMLATLQVKVEYARPLVYRAAHSIAIGHPLRSRHVSMAKEAAGRAAYPATRTSLQVYGALGYTWEQDLHIWMRRAWSLCQEWGNERFHRERVSADILSDDAILGPDQTFAA